jgi:hypothetical protein
MTALSTFSIGRFGSHKTDAKNVPADLVPKMLERERKLFFSLVHDNKFQFDGFSLEKRLVKASRLGLQ